MDFIESGKARHMKGQQVRPTFRTDLSGLLKFAQAMPPPSDPNRMEVQQDQVDLQDAESMVDPASQLGDQGQPQAQDQTQQDAPADDTLQVRRPDVQNPGGEDAESNDSLRQVRIGMAQLLNSAGVNADFGENMDGSLTYNVQIDQYYTDQEGNVYDNLDVWNAIRDFARKSGATAIKGPVLPDQRPAPQGLVTNMKPWAFSVTFGGKQKGQGEEQAAFSNAPPSPHAKPVGKVDPSARTRNNRQDQKKAASVGYTMPELMAMRKDQLIATLTSIINGSR